MGWKQHSWTEAIATIPDLDQLLRPPGAPLS